MTRKKRLHRAGESLADAVSNAWDAFDSPEYQARLGNLEATSASRAAEVALGLRIKKLRQWGVPKEVAEIITADAMDPLKSLVRLREHLLAGKPSLLLVLAGNPGCGKTTAATTRIEERETGCFVRATEFVEMGSHFSDRDLLSRYRRCGVLVIDDLGVEYHSDKMICRLDELIDSRISAGLATMITTNLTADEFRGRYEERIWSRLNAHGDYIEIDDPDLRIRPIGSGKLP